ncbi:MAG: hypothetical protein WC900_03465 [Oscillospiraceae bacterium]
MYEVNADACQQMISRIDDEMNRLSLRINEIKNKISYSSILGTVEWKAEFQNINKDFIREMLGEAISEEEFRKLLEEETYLNLRIKKCTELRDIIIDIMGHE